MLARERPHIILEAMSFLPQNQLVLLARKCAAAPVHASWLRNFHGSMEASFIQYAVADRIVLPPLEARGWAEAPLLMPHAHLVARASGRRCRRRRRRRGRLLRRRTKVAARRLAAARGDASRVQPQSA